MRWIDERFVRLYTRDTTTWKLLPWQSKALLPLLLRKLDRTGIVDLGDDGFDGIAALTDMPLELVTAAMPDLLRRRVFVLAGRELVMPHFIEAQEAVASPKLRAELHRERVKTRNETLQSVTKRDDSSRYETDDNAASRGITPIRAEPSSAVPDPDQRNVGFASPAPVGADVCTSVLDEPGTFPTAPRPKALTAEKPSVAKLAAEVTEKDSLAPSLPKGPAEDRTVPMFDAAIVAPVAKKPSVAKLAEEVSARVFAVYLAARTKAGRKGKAPRLNDKDRKLVAGRLAEGSTEEELCASARGIWIDDGLRKEQHRFFRHAMRDTNIDALGHLDAEARSVPVAAPALASLAGLEKPVGALPAQFSALCK